MRSSATFEHSEKTTKVNIFPDVGVETKNSNGNSLTSRSNLSTQKLDIKECVAQKSYNTFTHIPTMKQTPCTKLLNWEAFAFAKAKTLPAT